MMASNLFRSNSDSCEVGSFSSDGVLVLELFDTSEDDELVQPRWWEFTWLESLISLLIVAIAHEIKPISLTERCIIFRLHII